MGKNNNKYYKKSLITLKSIYNPTLIIYNYITNKEGKKKIRTKKIKNKNQAHYAITTHNVHKVHL